MVKTKRDKDLYRGARVMTWKRLDKLTTEERVLAEKNLAELYRLAILKECAVKGKGSFRDAEVAFEMELNLCSIERVLQVLQDYELIRNVPSRKDF